MADDTDQTINTPAVLLLGASSQIGVFAIGRLVRAGFQVFAVSRNTRPAAFPEFEQVTWLDENDALKIKQSCQYLLSAGPMDLALRFLQNGGHFQNAIVFSSSSVESKRNTGDPVERVQIQGMLQLESELQLCAAASGFKLLILRPTLIYGCGLDANISRLARWIQRFGFVPVNGMANGLRQPVHADDLASIAITAMLSEEELPAVLSLSGGDTLSYSEMLERIFAALEKPARIVRLPEWLYVLLVRLAGLFKTGRDLNIEMVKRQRLDLVFDDLQARLLLDYNPRGFAPTAADFSLPES